MKKLIISAVAALMMTMPVMAAGDVTVVANGTEIADKGVIIEERTMVPVRGVFENFGFNVEYEADTKTATLTAGDVVISMTQGENTFTINDEVITPDVPQQIVNDRFMLPLRAVGEAIGAAVEWDSETKTAFISTTVNSIDSEEITEATTEVTKDENGDFALPGISIDEVDPFDMGTDKVTEVELDI